jgi:hypothetical protein
MSEILTFLLLAILMFLSVFYIVKKTSRCNVNVLPGPTGWPVYQTVLFSKVQALHLKLYDWTEKYGDIFQFEVLGRKFVSLNSPKVLRETFNQEPNATITSFRPTSFVGKYILDNFADLALTSPDPLWTKRRKLTHQLIRSYGEGLSIIESQVKENLQSMKRDIQSTANQNVDPTGIVEEFVLNTVEVLVILMIYFQGFRVYEI